ncbi:MAG: (2E,6E)-farnesyl diphosphate synthase [Legionellales bacterium]|nr:(2E,6E)-farnesyl diphosphate synthase [Legionellales bacterium]
MKFSEFLLTCQKHIDDSLQLWLPAPNDTPRELHKAMRHSVLNGGKRIRPLLAYAAGYCVGGTPEQMDGVATAVEFVHAYSLIHDDLPAMDDSDLRRGKPTCHKAFDEATAILAGDALQSLAFEVIAKHDNPSLSAENRLRIIDILATACGTSGMAGGQAIDLAASAKQLTLEELENMHLRKTGALIRASVVCGAIATNKATDEELHALDTFAKNIGLAFQVHDDIIDIEQDTETLGKPQGHDQNNQKSTYPQLVGVEEAKAIANQLFADAVKPLDKMGQTALPLRLLGEYIIKREH